MFNVSTLLLDDSLKSAMPLTNDVINEMLQQFVPLSDILSQGSVEHTLCVLGCLVIVLLQIVS